MSRPCFVDDESPRPNNTNNSSEDAEIIHIFTNYHRFNDLAKIRLAVSPSLIDLI